MKSDVRALRPEYYGQFFEISALSQAQDGEMDALFSELSRALANQFIESSDEEGVSRRETILGILPDRGKEALEFRRRRILSRFGFLPPYTVESLKERLEEIFSGEAFSVSADFDNYKISVDGVYSDRRVVDAVLSAVRKIVPCNMAFSIRRKENTYGRLAGFTHDELSAFEQDILLGEIIG